MLKITRLADTAAKTSPSRVLRLDFDQRCRSRLAAMCEDGSAVAILLPRGTVLRTGDEVIADSGEHVRVEAADQPLARITAPSPLLLMRCLYHLANRHVKAQIDADFILIERDPVLEQMLQAMGARCDAIEAPFEPEAGAYHGHGNHARAHGEIDAVSATLGEQLSIEAHRQRNG